MRVAVVGGVLLVLVVACGGTTRTEEGPHDAAVGTLPDGSSGGTGGSGTGGSSGSGGGISFGGSAGFSATGGVAGDAGSVTVADAGLFDCFGCACNGQTSYCYSASGGFKTPPLPDAGACVDQEGGSIHCKPLPDTCKGAPSCGCIPEAASFCSCEDVGGGLDVHCNLP
jgi:hypothetical protein